MSGARLERVENSYGKHPVCPECDEETRVRPSHAKGGGIIAIVECRFCEYESVFYPVEVPEGDVGRSSGGDGA